MDDSYEDNPPVVLGAAVLAFVEIIPITNINHENHDLPQQDNNDNNVALSSAFVKRKLQLISRRSKLGIEWNAKKAESWQLQPYHYLDHPDASSADDTRPANDDDGPTKPNANPHKIHKNENQLSKGFLFSTEQEDSVNATTQYTFQGRPTISFASEDPLQADPVPCLVIGYAVVNTANIEKAAHRKDALVVNGTMVRILPAMSTTTNNTNDTTFLDELVGELPSSKLPDDLKEEISHNHDKRTIQELQLRMSLLLEEPVRIATTEDALSNLSKQHKRRKGIATAIQRYCHRTSTTSTSPEKNLKSIDPSVNIHENSTGTKQNNNSLPSILRDGALLVHSPDHAAGKTTLVKYIAREKLKCDAVHVIQPSALLAKFGSQADAGLESMMHAIALSAAVRGQGSICIILDHFNAMMPPGLSATSGAGDAAVPVLHAIASYLKFLVLSLKHRREFPFPTKNLLYNVGGKGGFVLAVRVCLVAIVTCPDNGWRSARLDLGRSTGLLDALPIGTYRLPSLDAATRIAAFENAFVREGVELTEDSKQQLKSLAVAALWARGRQFTLVARMAKQLVVQSGKGLGTVAEVERGFEHYARGKTGGTQLVARQKASSRRDPFSSVGGTADAKKSLLDALALDTSKRGLLESMGIESPIGVLLYGPPGCGKTLLAKAVASYLGADSKQFGGAFIPLNSSDIVQSEVGESEKLIVNSFLAARENAPSVIFIDEFQALFMERSSSGSSKLSSTLLQCMDDVKQWRKANQSASTESSKTVVVLGATNTPWMLDKSFLRPGRFDRIIHVGLPSQHDREAILKVHIGRMRIQGDAEAVATISRNVAEKTFGFSGAELAELCKSSAIRALIEKFEYVEEKHFVEEINRKPGGSSNSDLVRRNETWRP